MSYAKFNDKADIEFFQRIPNITGATKEEIECYATEAGYKSILTRSKTHQYCEKNYRETSKCIIEEWLEMSYEQAASSHKQRAEQRANEAIATTAQVDVSGLGLSAIYSPEKQTELSNLLVLGIGASYIDADGHAHEMSIEQLREIALALMAHKSAIEAQKLSCIRAIDTATTAASVAAVAIDY